MSHPAFPFLLTIVMFMIVLGGYAVLGDDNPLGEILHSSILLFIVALPITFVMFLVSLIKNSLGSDRELPSRAKQIIFLSAVAITIYLVLGGRLYLVPSDSGLGGLYELMTLFVTVPLAIIFGVGLLKKK